MTQDIVDKIIELRKQGFPARKISKITDVPEAMIWRKIKDLENEGKLEKIIRRRK